MLNVRRLGIFKYDIKEILRASQMDDTITQSFVAQVIAKASRISTKEAKEYIREVEKRGDYSQDVSDDICSLLDRFSIYR